MKKVLIANRGEIAVRLVRGVADAGFASVAIYAASDRDALHVRLADDARPLDGDGVAVYLDVDALVRIAHESGCDAVHPGYGFLSERADFARACEAAGLRFIGPAPETLELFGHKGRARAFAASLDVAVPSGTNGATTLDGAAAFWRDCPAGTALMLKAVAGGGGRGMRLVRDRAELPAAFERASSEAHGAFGNADLYVETFVPRARHVEVQIAGDGTGDVAHLFERECSLQRRNQKLVEVAPAPHLGDTTRERLFAAALALAREARFRNVGTFEFLVGADDASIVFIEANPRLQVEHTVTEMVTGIDLVRLQLELAAGVALRRVLRDREPRATGFAMQLRVNAETMRPDGTALPASGTIDRFDLPAGPGVRVDTAASTGYAIDPAFDSLLAKIVVATPSDSYAGVVDKAARALGELRVDGVSTNRAFLLALLARPEVRDGRMTTRFIDETVAELVDTPAEKPQEFEDDGDVLPVRAPVAGRLVSVDVAAGDRVARGGQIAVIDAMKMEHVVVASRSGIVASVDVKQGAVVPLDRVLVTLERTHDDDAATATDEAVDPHRIRPDLAESILRHGKLEDAAREPAVARRRKTGGRTVRENVAQLCDPGTFVEYGGLALPAQRRRRTLDDLIDTGQADGLVAGFGDVNGTLFERKRAHAMVLAYDYMVLAGTQGFVNHRKMDRLLDLAQRHRSPIVLFAEGGGGRPGDTDVVGVAGLDVMTFASFARLSGLVPRIGIVNGRCFAGNAALLGSCDVIIATANATIGMGGPAMIEGGGLGVFTPDEVGPLSIQVPNGVVDIAVADEIEAIDVAKRYLAYFQGSLTQWSCADQRLLRGAIPENRLRAYDVRRVLTALADDDSVLELRPSFARGTITALARVEGRPLGVVASNPLHLGGAIDADGADKGARFLQLCDAFSLPVLFLCDTPGIMVGPDAERTALVRHAARLFVNAATLSVPFFTIVLRKGYGLGAQAMAGGSFHAGSFTVSWPTGEFGAMGLEGAIRLGYRKELEAVADLAERRALYERMVAGAYEAGKALNMASFLEIDDVIDPADSRRWIVHGMDLAALERAQPSRKRRTFVDTW